MDIRLITTQEELDQFCASIRHVPCIAVDTEFMRERTYFAKLCLIQVASQAGNALIDPITGVLDLAPLIEIFNDPKIVKVMHSPEQDIEILFHLTGKTVDNLFDSQIAAMALGLGDTIAYNSLVQMLLGATLDKTQQYTDWLRRPLSDAQKIYALADVTYLLELYPLLVQRLEQGGRTHWMDDALADLTNPEHYESKPDEVYLRIKHQLRKPEQLAALQCLAAWREQRAIKRDLPRGHIIRDEMLIEIAKHMPRDVEHFKAMRLPRPIKDEGLIARLVEVVSIARERDPASYPDRRKRPDVVANSELVGLLSLLLKQRCRDIGVASRLVATRGDLNDVAVGKTDIPCMQGWRAEVFGNAARELMAGKLAFHWDANEQQVVMG